MTNNIECGAALTQKMEGMFKDMELSREFNTAFKQVGKCGYFFKYNI